MGPQTREERLLLTTQGLKLPIRKYFEPFRQYLHTYRKVYISYEKSIWKEQH
jgi:hypothetical protein